MKTTNTEKSGKEKKATKPVGAVMVPVNLNKPSTKHGRSVNALLRKLSGFEWDFDAMKRV